MNPLMDQESKSLNKAGNNLAITLANGEMPLEMRLNLLSDLDIELSEKGLIEILPAEISKLLKSEVSDSSEPISFISKDILNGELKDFINNLVGNEVIQNNITYQEGLLLSLEDSESAVNLELSKSLKTSPDNIAVPR